MAQNVIALISDCDGTICPDTASLLVSELGLSPAEFWLEVSADVENGWDPPLAWLNRLIDKSRSGSVPPLTSDLIRQVGEKVDLFPGVSDFLTTPISTDASSHCCGVRWPAPDGSLSVIMLLLHLWMRKGKHFISRDGALAPSQRVDVRWVVRFEGSGGRT